MEGDLKQSVMRRVYITYMLRRIFSPFMLRIYIGIVLAWQMLVAVSVSSVMANVPSMTEPGRIYHFLTSAFLHTEVWVQFVSIALGVFLAWFLVDAIKRSGHLFGRRSAVSVR